MGVIYMNIQNRLKKIENIVAPKNEDIPSKYEIIDSFRPRFERYALVAKEDRINGTTEKWKSGSMQFLVCAYFSYVKDDEEPPEFLNTLINSRRNTNEEKNNKSFEALNTVAAYIILQLDKTKDNNSPIL